jgi:hypothetical protein
MHPWLARLRHDLLKHALWCARDLRDCGRGAGPLSRADLQALRRSLLELVDSEGSPITATQLWQGLRADSAAPPAALDAFEAAVGRAEAAVRASSDPASDETGGQAALTAVLALESAFFLLAQHLDP